MLEKRDLLAIAGIAVIVSLIVSWVVPLAVATVTGIAPVVVMPFVMPLGIKPAAEPDLTYTLTLTTATVALAATPFVAEMAIPHTAMRTAISVENWIAGITMGEKVAIPENRVYEVKVFAGGVHRATMILRQDVAVPAVGEGVAITVDLMTKAPAAPPAVSISVVRLS